MNRYLKADDRNRKQMIEMVLEHVKLPAQSIEKDLWVNGMDYTPDVRNRLVLVPRADIIDAWKTDYEQMMGSMIYGDKPTWDELIAAMKELQDRVRKHMFHVKY